MQSSQQRDKDGFVIDEALLQEFAHAQEFMDQSPIGLALFIGQDLRVYAVNGLMREMWSRTMEQSLYKGLLELMPELRGQGFEHIMLEVMKTGKPFISNETEASFTREGQMRTGYFNITFQPFRSRNGQIIGILNSAFEVTHLVERRREVERRELLLQDSNLQLEQLVLDRTGELKIATQNAEIQRQELQRVFEQAPVAIFVVKGPRYLVELMNPKMSELLDQPIESSLGRPLFDVIPTAANQGFEQLLDQVMSTGVPIQFSEHPATLSRQGKVEVFYFNFVYTPFRDSRGEIIGVTAVAVDVSDHRQMRMQVIENEARFRTMLESMPQMMWTSLPDGSPGYFSALWERYTGLDLLSLGEDAWKR